MERDPRYKGRAHSNLEVALAIEVALVYKRAHVFMEERPTKIKMVAKFGGALPLFSGALAHFSGRPNIEGATL